jgi:alpha-tubulin suppressor-like RCC1 family protein
VPDSYSSATWNIAAGGATTCRTDPPVRCWGDDRYGQHGDGVADDSVDLTSPPFENSTVHIAFGARFAIARWDAEILGWGDAAHGTLGAGVGDVSATPVPLDLGFYAGDTLVSINAGSEHACLGTLADHSSNGRFLCWGKNDRGQLGNGTRSDQPQPLATDVLLDGGGSYFAMDLGGAHSCAYSLLMSDTDPDIERQIYCWGANEHGQLGIGSRDDSPEPLRVIAY